MYEDCWLFDVQAEKWHNARLRVYGNTIGMGKRIGHTLSPIISQPYSCLLFGGGPDVQTMLMCNDAFILDIRMNTAYPAGQQSSTHGSSGSDKSSSSSSGSTPSSPQSAAINAPDYSPFVMQPSLIQKKSIAPRMYHTMDYIGESYYIVYGGYAGHRSCGGVWGMNMANASSEMREKQRQKEVRNKEYAARGKTVPQPANELADPAQNYHHIPFAPSPFEANDQNRIQIKEVQMVGNNGKSEIMAANRHAFPHAYDRDNFSHTLNSKRLNVGMYEMPTDDITQLPSNFNIYSITSFGTPEQINVEAVDKFITYMTIHSYYNQIPGPTGITPAVPPPQQTPRGAVPYASQPLYTPTPEQIISLCQLALHVLQAEHSLLSVPLPCKVFGDLHGDYFSLIKFFQQFGDVRVLNNFTFLFLGDYVDRGPCSINIVCLLFALKIRYPSRVYLLRGNHESRSMCGDGHKYTTLLAEFFMRFSQPGSIGDKNYQSTYAMTADLANNLWNLVIDCFDFLPFAAVIGRCIFAVHGGLSHSLPTLNQIFLIPRGKTKDAVLNSTAYTDNESVRGGGSAKMMMNDPRPYQTGVVLTPAQELLWNDAARTDNQEDPWVPNHIRKCGYYFNATVVENFCKQNGLKLILRGHEVCMDGFDYFAKRKLITIFSAPRYCGMENHGVIVDVFSENNVKLKVLDGRNAMSMPTSPTSGALQMLNQQQQPEQFKGGGYQGNQGSGGEGDVNDVLVRNYYSSERAPTPPRRTLPAHAHSAPPAPLVSSSSKNLRNDSPNSAVKGGGQKRPNSPSAKK